MRGIPTQQIIDKANLMLNIENINATELRLMPYIQYLVTNDASIEPSRINSKEREILRNWNEKGWIKDHFNDLRISKKFWDAICEIIYLGYANHD